MSKKLNLNDLKVKSFVTEDKSLNVNTVKGGKQNVNSFRRWCPGTTTEPVDLPSRDALDCSAWSPYECVSGVTCNL